MTYFVDTAVFSSILRAFRPVLSIGHDVIDAATRLVRDNSRLSAQDAVHVATCRLNGIADVITPDRDFDDFQDIRRIDPTTIPVP